MFFINEKTHDIVLTQGNSCEIDTTPFFEDTEMPIVLGEGDKILFTVKSSNGKIYLKKILTNADYTNTEDTSINIILKPEDTVNLQPHKYVYDLLLVYADGRAYTYVDESIFEIKKAVGTIKDLEE